MVITGFVVFLVGVVGVAIGSKGQRGWDIWTGRQKVICSVAFVMVLVGLVLADAGEGRFGAAPYR
ncbi:hypothetical protein ACFYWX_46215 [Streptomyces sp. NPDC002888]|uniref:hypothetical protein n=1 Tax=Streptomyces sp. NPDC002888 TaxID=3364668 RepID=UPI0036A509D4